MHYKHLERFLIELKNRNYAFNTIKIYSNRLENFLKFSYKNTKYSPEERIFKFLDTFNGTTARCHAYSAIKLFYEYVLKKTCPYNLNKVKKRSRLPYFLSRNEIINILNCITNENHYLLVAFLYASGLRVSEVINIKVRDIDLENKLLTVKNSK